MKITVSSITVAKTLSEYRGKFKRAPVTLASLCSETTIIGASLSRIQTLLLQDVSTTSARLENRPDVRDAFDKALMGCMLVFSCLEEDIRGITRDTMHVETISWESKFLTLWNEDAMAERLRQLRGQQTALSLLVGLLQM